MMAEMENSGKSGSRRKHIRKEKELASGEGMGDDLASKEQDFASMDENGVMKLDRSKLDTIVSV